MGFGFLHKLQSVLDVHQNGVGYVSAHTMTYGFVLGTDNTNALVSMEYTDDNIGPGPDQLISTTPAGGSSNPVVTPRNVNIRLGSATPAGVLPIYFVAMNLLKTQATKGAQYLNYDTTGIPGANRLKRFKWIFQNAERLIHFGVYGGGTSSSGSMINDPDLNFPFFPNLKSIYMRGGTSSASSTGVQIVNFKGRFPDSLEAFGYLYFQGTRMDTIEKAFPAMFKQLMLGVNSSSLAGDLSRLIAACVNLESLILTNEDWISAAPTATTNLPVSGTLNLSHLVALKNLSVHGTGITAVNLSGLTDVNIKRVRVSGATGISGTDLLNLVNLVLASNAGTVLNIAGCEKTLTRNFTDGEFSTLETFTVEGNKITGTITLTTARPALKYFRLGSNADRVLANRHAFATVNISGLTGATTIDLTNSGIQFLTLPVNTVATLLYLGGNSLTLANNPNIVSQIRAMTALTDLRLSTGTSGTTDSNCGAIGAVNVDNLNLTIFIATNGSISGACQVKGTAISTLWVNHNPALTSLLSSTGLFPGTLNLQLHQCPLLNFDFSQLRNASVFSCANIGNTVVDLRNMGIATVTVFNLNGNANLTEVKFPVSTPLNIAFNITSVQLNDNPNLTTMSGLENIVFTTGSSSQKNFNAQNCALNITFPFGVNSFTPPRINISNNGMSVANVDATVTSSYNNRGKFALFTSIGGGRLFSLGGSNASPTGTYQR